MSIMFPSYLHSNIKSDAEKVVFNWFKNSPNTDDWIVLHSLGVPEHVQLIYGEIDFLVIAPCFGIFTLEIKGGRVSCKNGVWEFTNRFGETSIKARSPFEQANSGMFSVKNAIEKRFGKNSLIASSIFGSGVMFPDIVFSKNGFEFSSNTVFDAENRDNVFTFIANLSKHVANKWEEKYGDRFPRHKLSKKEAMEIADFLRPNFDFFVSLSGSIHRSETKILAFTKEQFRCVDQLEDNPRVLVRGPAGTGKTLIAVETIKRALASKENVCFFCFNQNLAIWLRSFLKEEMSTNRLTITSFYAFLLKTLGTDNSFSIDCFDSHYFLEILPSMALERILEQGSMFDRIVIDEAQDLLLPDNLEIIDALLTKGIGRGKWNFFGDFSSQSIFTGSYANSEMITSLEKRASFVNYKLNVNCRNSRNICTEILSVSSLNPGNCFFESVDSLPVQYYSFITQEEEKKKIEDSLDKLLKSGISPKDIVLLSPRTRHNSVVKILSEQFKVEDFSLETTNISFSTIHSFKGLEQKVVLIVDIVSYDDKKLIYVGFSRAKDLLLVFESIDASKQRSLILLNSWEKKNG